MVMVLLLAVLYYLYIRLKQNKPIISRIRIIKHVPAHQKALTAIEKIKQEKIVYSEDQKTYYTLLTDALRQYIFERFGFNAMEMTTGEIIDNLQAADDKVMISELKDLFSTADLVKFAKYSALANENDLNLVNAIRFIDDTKIEGQPTEEQRVARMEYGYGIAAGSALLSLHPTEAEQAYIRCRRVRIIYNEEEWSLPIKNTSYYCCYSYHILHGIFLTAVEGSRQ